MNKIIKKIISREVLLLVFAIGLGVLIMFTGNTLKEPIKTDIDEIAKANNIDVGRFYESKKYSAGYKTQYGMPNSAKEANAIIKIFELEPDYIKYDKIRDYGFFLIIFVYPLYMLIRFIMWFESEPRFRKYDRIRSYRLFLIVLIYPVYLLTRFIIWAVKKVRKK